VALCIGAFGLAVVFGLASAILGGWFVVSVLMVPAVLVLLLVRPEYALVASIALICDLVHPAIVPRVPFLGGSIAAADATLLMLTVYAFCLFGLQAGKARPVPVAGGRWLTVSAALFGLCLLAAVTLSLTYQGLSATVVLGEARDLSYLLLLPVMLVMLREPERQRRFVIGIVVLGCLFAIGQILQGVFRIPVFGTSGMSALETLGFTEHTTTRSNTHGMSIIIFALLLTVGAYLLGAIKKAVFIPAAALLLVGIFLTFGRTNFAVVALSGFVLVLWLNARRLPHMLLFLFSALAVIFVVMAAWKPETLFAVLYRMTSIRSELTYGYSAGWRFAEVDAMLPLILQHPLIGIGLGADYKGIHGSSAVPELNRYMHNAYFYMAGKMGVPALAFYLSFMAAVFFLGRRLARSDASPWARVLGAAGAAMMIRFVFSSITEPHLMSDHGVTVIAVSAALVYLAARRVAANASERSPSGAGAMAAPVGRRAAPTSAGRMPRHDLQTAGGPANTGRQR
jgi:O-antigen ligase